MGALLALRELLEIHAHPRRQSIDDRVLGDPLQFTVAKHAARKWARIAAEIEHTHDLAELLARHRRPHPVAVRHRSMLEHTPVARENDALLVEREPDDGGIVVVSPV
jgi:hypothetical protein